METRVYPSRAVDVEVLGRDERGDGVGGVVQPLLEGLPFLQVGVVAEDVLAGLNGGDERAGAADQKEGVADL